METPNLRRPNHGRAARAATLIAALEGQIPLTHPARPIVRELQTLYPMPPNEVRELLEHVPGKSLQKKADAIGVSKTAVAAMWAGKYVPSAEVYGRILAAAGIRKLRRTQKRGLQSPGTSLYTRRSPRKETSHG